MQTLMHIPACITEIFLSYPSFFHLTQSPAEEVRPNVPLLPWQQRSHTLFFSSSFFHCTQPPNRRWKRGAGATVQGCLTWAVEHRVSKQPHLWTLHLLNRSMGLLSSLYKVLDFMMWKPFVFIVLHFKWYVLQAETEMGSKPTALVIGVRSFVK